VTHAVKLEQTLHICFFFFLLTTIICILVDIYAWLHHTHHNGHLPRGRKKTNPRFHRKCL